VHVIKASAEVVWMEELSIFMKIVSKVFAQINLMQFKMFNSTHSMVTKNYMGNAEIFTNR
jgi:hypothetical protein